ncbi:MFS transporter [Streptomyces sp. NPDC005485]|uniref:MFS transporter n=1 Tax=Streptomyces sp. NPDC005485 TaxID=3155591 RepID=UPI0033B4F45B
MRTQATRKIRDFGADPQERRLLFTVAVDATGSGLLISGATLFYTRVTGLSSGQIGAGLSAMGVVGLLATVPNGQLVDRIGPRRALIALHLWRAVWCSALAFVDTFWQFLTTLMLLGVAEFAGMPALQAYVARAFGDERRMRVMARVQVTKNTGFLVGALLASAAIATGTTLGYRMLLLGDGVSFLIAAALIAAVRTVAGPASRRTRGPSPLAPLKNARFLALTCCNGILQLNLSALTVGMPLWLATRTQAPPAIAPLLIAVNTVIAITLQIPLSRGAETVPGAGRHLRRAGLSLALMCTTLVLASWTSQAGAALLMVASVVLHTLGEIWHASGGWGLQFALSPEEERGSYAAAFSLGPTAEGMIGPSLVGAGVVAAGAPGWLALAAAFLGAGAVAHRIARGAAAPEPAVQLSTADRRAAPADTADGPATVR